MSFQLCQTACCFTFTHTAQPATPVLSILPLLYLVVKLYTCCFIIWIQACQGPGILDDIQVIRPVIADDRLTAYVLLHGISCLQG
jgi:hypothetical protein